MKNFKDNLDEESIDAQGADRFASTASARTFVQKALHVLSRYSLLIILGLAALSITVLHFQGKHLLQALRGTPLPTFWLERVTGASAVPDKTDIYEQVLAEEAKAAWQKRSQQITKPRWEAGYQKTTTNQKMTEDSVVAQKEPPENEPAASKAIPVRKKRPRKQEAAVEAPLVVEVASSFFQPVRAVSSVANTLTGQHFVSCVVHGDQEVGNRKRMVLRLTEAAIVYGKEVSVGTLVYGMARLAQDRIQISISSIGTQAVRYQVYDHTYNQGITLDERENLVEDATKETAYRQGNRRVRQLPTRRDDVRGIASDLTQNILRRTRQRKQTIFLPDGYPLYLAGQ